MGTLNGFPLVNQRTTVTGDGRPSENSLYDCVAACIDAMSRYWLKTPENSVFNPDHFKDVAYGENWQNDGTDAACYMNFCKTLGINLSSITADSPAHAVALAHEYINKGIPVTFTEVDPYVDTSLPQYAGWTHACCWFADDGSGLTALDPFIGQALYKSNGAWANVLRSNQLWVAELEELVIDIHTPGVSDFFTEQDTNHWLCKQTNKIIRFAVLDTYKKHGGSGLCGLTWLGLPKTPELPIEGIDPIYQHLTGQGITVQFFERGCLVYDVKHQVDNPPGSNGIYAAQIYGLPGQDPVVKKLQTDLAKAQQPQVTGVEIAKIKNFQTALELQAHDLITKAQALEAAIIVPLS